MPLPASVAKVRSGLFHLLRSLSGNELSLLARELELERECERREDADGVRRRNEGRGAELRLAAAYLDEAADG